MPQLDKLSFLNQLIWFFLFYIIFYFMMIKTFIPTIGRTLKLRAKLLNSLGTKATENTPATKTILNLSNIIIQQTQNVFSDITKNILYKDTFLDVLNNNDKISNLKSVYVKEMVKLTAKKKLINKK